MLQHSQRRSNPMAKKNDTTNLTEILLRCMGEADPMLSMLEWLCVQLMGAGGSSKLGAEKDEHSNDRTGSRSGYRPRRYDTRMGTMYLLIPKIRNGGYIPFFVTERKRSEAALIQVVQEAFVQGVSLARWTNSQRAWALRTCPAVRKRHGSFQMRTGGWLRRFGQALQTHRGSGARCIS